MIGRGMWGALAVVLLFAGRALGDEPEPEPAPAPRPVAPETLPAPRSLAVPDVAPHALPFPPYQRINRWDVWQNYAVDRYGMWKPLVVYSPSGAYYRYNHQPFPWAITHSMEWMPYANDTEYPNWPVPAVNRGPLFIDR